MTVAKKHTNVWLSALILWNANKKRDHSLDQRSKGIYKTSDTKFHTSSLDPTSDLPDPRPCLLFYNLHYFFKHLFCTWLWYINLRILYKYIFCKEIFGGKKLKYLKKLKRILKVECPRMNLINVQPFCVPDPHWPNENTSPSITQLERLNALLTEMGLSLSLSLSAKSTEWEVYCFLRRGLLKMVTSCGLCAEIKLKLDQQCRVLPVYWPSVIISLFCAHFCIKAHRMIAHGFVRTLWDTYHMGLEWII